jgi:ribosomal-protein-alanine N-acetyltransferase
MLRALHGSDDRAVLALLSDERVIQYMLFPRFTEEMARRFTERFQSPEPSGAPAQVVRGITEEKSDALIGLCGLVLDDQRTQGEVWYLAAPTHWGRGIVTTAARALVDHGFRRLHLHRVWASCLPENPASGRVLEKLGFRREGVHSANLRIHGVWRDSYTYAILAREWAAV